MLFEYMINLIESVAFTWFLYQFRDPGVTSNRSVTLFIAANFIFVCLVNVLPGFETFAAFLLQIMFFLFLCHIAPKKYWRNALLAIIPYTVFGVVSISMDTIAMSIAGVSSSSLLNNQNYYIPATILFNIVSICLLRLICSTFKKRKLFIADRATDYVVFFLILISLQISLLIIGGYIFPDVFVSWNPSAIVLPVILVCILVFELMRINSIKNSMLQEQITTIKILQAQADTGEYLHITELKIRKMLHDLKHLVSTLDITSDEFAKLNAYHKTLDELIVPPNTASKLLNYILYQRLVQAAERQIQVKLSLNINSEIPILQSDFLLLLSNILDNAIEHCGNDKQISITMSDENYHLSIAVENSIDTPAENSKTLHPFSTSEHGYGVQTIKEITCKYDGLAQFDSSSDRFLVTVIIPY